MKITNLKDKLTIVPVPVLDKDDTGYPANMMGYYRMYYKGNWWGTAFRIHKDLETPDLVSEFDSVIYAFRDTFKDLTSLKRYCRENAKDVLSDWCGYDRWVLYLTLDNGVHEFDVRTMPGDYNLYLRCYKKEVA